MTTHLGDVVSEEDVKQWCREFADEWNNYPKHPYSPYRIAFKHALCAALAALFSDQSPQALEEMFSHAVETAANASKCFHPIPPQ